MRCRTQPPFSSSRSVRVLHAAVRRRKFEVQVLAGAPSLNDDHNVRVASGPVKAAVRVQVPLINPTSNRAQGEETNRRSAKPIYPVQVRGARHFS